MKLFYKIYAFLIVLLVFILAGAGYFSYHRETKLFHNDMIKDAQILGEAMSGMVGHAWKHSGPEKAVALIRDANSKAESISIRWVNLTPSVNGSHVPIAPPERLKPVLQGRSISLVVKSGEQSPCRLTYVPVKTGDDFQGAIELCESLMPLTAYTRNTLRYHLITGLMIMLAAGGLLWFHFRHWINRPLMQFIEKSRKIGQGDLAPDLVVKGHDEFATLGQTLNSMCRDLSASREAVRLENERRIEAMEQLRHSERLAVLGRLSAGMAHELGTPLNVISGRAKQIRSGALGSVEVIEFSNIIDEQAQRITKIVNNLLAFARRRKPKRSLQDMEVIVNQVLDMLREAADKSKVVFKIIRQGQISSVSVDVLQIQQVLTNLVLNGIQAMAAGGCLEVVLAEEKKQHPEADMDEKSYLAIHVQDEGPGISLEHLSHLFEPFFTTKDVGEGTGLGLSIAYGIIQEHGGWIEAENRSGKGACFTVFLPLDSPS